MDNGNVKKTPESIGNLLAKHKFGGNHNIDNIKDSFNIDNSIDNSRYAFKSGFVPRTQETQIAYEIAEALGDLGNYAFYRKTVQKLTSTVAMRLLAETREDVKRGQLNGKVIRKPAALFNWKVKRRLKRYE